MDGHLEELLAFYALGGLTDAERAQVEAYVASNPEAKSRLEAMIQTTSALAYEAAPVKPPAALKKTLMDRVNADARTRSASVRQSPAPGRSRLLGLLQPRAGNWLPHAVAALSLLVALGAGGWALSLSNEIARLQTETNALRQELAAQRRVLAQLAAPNAQVIAIAGTEHQPGAHGQLIADSQTGSAVLVVAGLRPLGSGNVEAAGVRERLPVLADQRQYPGGRRSVQSGRAGPGNFAGHPERDSQRIQRDWRIH